MIPLLHHKLLFSPGTGAKQPVHAGAYFRHSKVSLEESVLSGHHRYPECSGKIVYASNGTLSDDDRASLATDIQGLRDQLLNLANTTDGNGRYILPVIKQKLRRLVRRMANTKAEQKVLNNRSMLRVRW